MPAACALTASAKAAGEKAALLVARKQLLGRLLDVEARGARRSRSGVRRSPITNDATSTIR